MNSGEFGSSLGRKESKSDISFSCEFDLELLILLFNEFLTLSLLFS
jgi:hypothetical protein